jgi:hypothetical protein
LKRFTASISDADIWLEHVREEVNRVFTFKNLATVVVAAHGIGFSLWFLAAWLGMKIGPGSQWLFSDVSIVSPVGRIFGLLALALMIAFLVTAFGIFTGTGWWPALGLTTAAIASIVVILWWNIVTPASAVGALAVNALVMVAAVLVGAGQQFVEHA